MNTEQMSSEKYGAGNISYEKLSRKALYCMYASGIVTGAVLLFTAFCLAEGNCTACKVNISYSDV